MTQMPKVGILPTEIVANYSPVTGQWKAEIKSSVHHFDDETPNSTGETVRSVKLGVYEPRAEFDSDDIAFHLACIAEILLRAQASDITSNDKDIVLLDDKIILTTKNDVSPPERRITQEAVNA